MTDNEVARELTEYLIEVYRGAHRIKGVDPLLAIKWSIEILLTRPDISEWRAANEVDFEAIQDEEARKAWGGK